MSEEKIVTILTQHLPHRAIDYCLELWKAHPFQLRITKSRQSKAGDFYCHTPHSIPRISLNNDLNPYLFLITYIHEVAHLLVYRKHKRNVDPHGTAWKLSFQELMLPMLTPDIFPDPVLHILNQHMHSPKASSFADAELTRILRMYDPHGSTIITVSELPEGSLFMLRGRHFRKGKLKRTRYLCHEVKSRKQYLVPSEAPVDNVQLTFGFS